MYHALCTISTCHHRYILSIFMLVIPMSITPSEMVKIQLPQLRIDIVQRQAQHLGLTLVGVPMHRASSEPFVNRIGRALELLQKEYGKKVAGQNIGEKITGSHVI